MEFLRPAFHDELNEGDEIVIAGQTFLRHDILNGLAPDVYEIAFQEWLEIRKLDLFEKAEDILKRFDNRSRFESLSVAFRSGRIIPFVGAGMSVPSGYPAWTKFLFDVCGESHVPRVDLSNLLDKGEYERAAQLLHDNLGSSLFNENLETTFSHEKTIIGPVNYLPVLFPASSILTTNFDTVIENLVKDDAHQGFDMVESGKSLPEAIRQMAAGTRILVKLHGDCRRVRDRVLMKTEYETAYSSGGGSVKDFVERIMFGQSLLFLGCSLNVDRTLVSMKEAVTRIGAENLPRHYALLELKDGDDRIARKKHLSEANIFPIWYEEGDHDGALEALFLKLMEEQ